MDKWEEKCKKCNKFINRKCFENKSNCMYFEKFIAGKEVYKNIDIFLDKNFYNKVPEKGNFIVINFDGILKPVKIISYNEIKFNDLYIKLNAYVRYYTKMKGQTDFKKNLQVENYYELKLAVKSLVKLKDEKDYDFKMF